MRSVTTSAKRLAVFAGLAAAAGMMAGCAKARPRYDFSETVAGSFYNIMAYACENGVGATARFDRDTLRLSLGEGTYALPQLPAPTGTRYGDSGASFWMLGAEARFEKKSFASLSCRYDSAATKWEQAWARGVSLRATGAEIAEHGKIDWTLEITTGKGVVFVTDNGKVRASYPDTIPGFEPSALRRYGHPPALAVEWDRRPCREGGSGEPLDLTVKVEYEGKKYLGCGRSGR